MDSDSQMGNQTIEESMPIRPKLSSDIIKWILSGDEVAEEIEVELNGRKNYNGKIMIVNEFKHKHRLINDLGINSIKILIVANIGKGTINSNLDDDDIKEIMLRIDDILSDSLFQKWQEWGIEKTNIDTIKQTVINNCLYALKRAEENITSSKVFGTIKHTQISNTANKKPAGFKSWLGLG